MKTMLETTPNQTFIARQKQTQANVYTYAKHLRLDITGAKGVMVRDADGKQYYDCLAASGTLVLGHNHPVVHAAISEAMRSSPMQTLDATIPIKDAFVETLFSTLPERLAKHGRIQFCGSTGANAIEAVVKRVKTVTGRCGMISFHGGYHGMTHGALALTGNLASRTAIAELMGGVQFMPYPQDYRCPFGVGGGHTGHRISSNYLDFVLSDPESGVSPAGVLLEVVQGEAGVNPAPEQWLQDIRRITEERQVPLIFDEVQTGWGRTGQLYALEQAGVSPDILVLSKAIGGGLAMAIVVYDEKLDHWQSGTQMETFRVNQWAMATGLATLNHILTHDIPAHAQAMGKLLTYYLYAIQSQYSCLGDIRGRGLMIGVEIVDVISGKQWLGAPAPDPKLARRIKEECLKQGLIIELAGRFDTVIRFLPPLTITAAEIDAIADIFFIAVRSACTAPAVRLNG